MKLILIFEKCKIVAFGAQKTRTNKIGPFFFENEQGEAVTVNSSRGSHLNEIIFHYLTKGLYFRIKKEYLADPIVSEIWFREKTQILMIYVKLVLKKIINATNNILKQIRSNHDTFP